MILTPLIADQLVDREIRIETLSGERVMVDPAVTIQSIYNISYW